MARVRIRLNGAGVRKLLQSKEVAGHLEAVMRSAAAGEAEVSTVTGRTRANVRAEIRGDRYESRRNRLMGILGRL